VTTALHITAASGTGGIVLLTHDDATTLGNIAITETVADVDYAVSGMTGGAGGNCATGQECQQNIDCEPKPGATASCVMNTCQ
jgi:hypothetical protein